MSSTLVETSKIIELSECNLESKTLLTGTLLKWIDITACLSAEKHANAPCVTASVDDLQLQKTIRLGQVLIIKAWINRSWNTSMEVEVSVFTEDITLEQSKICKAFFTFVTQPDKNGKKQLVKPVEPVGEHENIQFRLANERKRMRLDYRESLKSLKENIDQNDLSPSYDKNLSTDCSLVEVENTFCQCIEIVLPQHANHHQTTFGGQLMAWMEATGTISARRLSHCQPRLVAVDEVFFRAPSKVGDRIVIKSCVNNTFDKSMEVGVRVEAYALGGNIRHIQSAYFTFIAPDQNGNPLSLPKMNTTIKENFRRMVRAEKRVALRTERRNILCSDGPVVSIALTKYNQKILCYKNILCLMQLYNEPGFKVTYLKDDLRLYQCKVDGKLCIRVECEIQAKPSVAYNVLSDHTLRKHWDMAVTDVTVIKEIRKDEDCILHYSMQNLSPRDNVKGDDFVVLASTRTDSRDMHSIAYRSVKIDELPPVAEYHRAENKCSGFVIEPYKSMAFGNGCKITYVNELTDHVFQYVKQDLRGATHSLAKRAIALKELIRAHVPPDG